MQIHEERLPFPVWLRVLGLAIAVAFGPVGLFMTVVDTAQPPWERVGGVVGLALGLACGLLLLLVRQHNHVRADGAVTVGFPPLWWARLSATDVSVEPAGSVRGLEHGLGLRWLGDRTWGVIASPGTCVVLHGRSWRFVVRTDRPDDVIAAVRGARSPGGRRGETPHT